VHCSDGGFVLDKNSYELTSPDKWADVLEQRRFQSLKVNFAHFGKESRKRSLFLSRHEWRERIGRLMMEYPNVYADFSYVGTDMGNYRMLEKICKGSPHIAERLLFGSDFMINLMDMESYNSYLEIFSKTGSFSASQKLDICNINPEQFLWRQ
jgi:predicted TIM-barrel fold metal-dependent hydrolase